MVPGIGTIHALTVACWLPVVWLQLRAARLAEEAVASGQALPKAYHDALRLWFFLGWPAFIAVLAIFWLMLAKPSIHRNLVPSISCFVAFLPEALEPARIRPVPAHDGRKWSRIPKIGPCIVRKGHFMAVFTVANGREFRRSGHVSLGKGISWRFSPCPTAPA
ncbi:MAG: DUF2269 domain-containing protein [Inquilinus limosus]|uniref:DUF2269 domain-containing protein n=1 Tax=Inquilinus limosus TaxID=171674 RepID=A0A952FQY2_9PROT|nr:DUF2269 domain-containing protein [Inquilinus limosus]